MAGEAPLPALFAGYTVRPVTAEDHDAVYDLVVADRTHYTGTCRVPRQMLSHWIDAAGAHLSAVVERDGILQQWWNAMHETGTGSFSCAVNSRPGLPDIERLEATGWQAIREWAGPVLADPERGVLRCSRPIQDEEGIARLVRNGFTPTHTFWQMGGDVPKSPAPERHSPPEGLTVEGSADAHQVHDVMQEGFAEHYAYSPQSFEEAIEEYRTRPGYNPAGWYLARVDGRNAGAMVLSWENEPRGALQVLELATLSWARGRGVATSLLRTAFDVARRDGLQRVELFVDSENTTGAPSLYRTAGLDVLQASQQFEGRISRSRAQP